MLRVDLQSHAHSSSEGGIALEPFYLIYTGQSEDGRGQPKLSLTTHDTEVAKRAFKKIKDNPYSCGKVVRVADNRERLMWDIDDFPAAKGE